MLSLDNPIILGIWKNMKEVRQWEGWHPTYDGTYKSHVWNHQPAMDGDWMVTGGVGSICFFLMDSLVDGNEECDTGEVQIDRSSKKTPYPLVMSTVCYWTWPIYSWFTYWRWWFSIVMLVYQSVLLCIRFWNKHTTQIFSERGHRVPICSYAHHWW